MKKIIFAVLILFIFSFPVFAGELYSCIDRNGNSIITDTPQDGMKDCILKESYRDATPQEKAQWQKERESYRQRVNREIENKRAARQAQASRDRRADQLKSDAAARLRAVRDAGIKLPQANIDMLEKAAEVKAEQIRQGTDTPMTAQEDADFHARERQRDLEWKLQAIERKQ